MFDSGLNVEKENSGVFSKYILSVFPHVKIERLTQGNDRKRFYVGIELKPLLPLHNLSDKLCFENIVQYIPDTYTVMEASEKYIQCETNTSYKANGHAVKKCIIFSSDNTWKLQIADKDIDLKSLLISNTYQFTKEHISVILETVQKVKICEGVTVTKSVTCSRFHTLERWENTLDEQIVRKLRSVICTKVVNFTSTVSICRTCQKMTLGGVSKEKTQTNLDPKTRKVTAGDITKLIPNATKDMVTLLLSQANNAGSDPRGRRWPKDIISICLQLYNRSLLGHNSLRDSGILILPSPSLLILYKNSVHQQVGFHTEIFKWMHTEAKRLKIPTEGWTGGIVIDEMSIQEDLQICKSGDGIEIVGLVDLGEEGNICKTLRVGKKEKQLGNHVCQFVFLGLTGFRFPFAHFVSDQIQAYDLHTLFWEAIDQLQVYDFRCVFTCMDGAQSNRSFLHMNLGPERQTMTVKSPCNFEETVISMMDYSHVMKKVRNNIIKSGLKKTSTRNLTLPNDDVIQWQMWTDCYQWDQQNGLQIHRRLTNEHIFPSQQCKMRNHLAEEVLNCDMLHLFLQYQSHLGAKGSVLNGTIQLLRQTSALINIFRDVRSVSNLNDNRLKQLQEILSWFGEWKSGIQAKSLLKKEKTSCLMSTQCMEDLESCIIGFIELCSKLLTHENNVNIFLTPALINSDVVENEFNQQRSTYNGANTNPNALQYRRSLNSIIIGQSVISKKGNAGLNKFCSAQPYSYQNPNPLKPKKRKQNDSQHDKTPIEKIKVIRL